MIWTKYCLIFLLDTNESWWWGLQPYHEATRGPCYNILVELRLVGGNESQLLHKDIFENLSINFNLKEFHCFKVAYGGLAGKGRISNNLKGRLALIEMRANREQK